MKHLLATIAISLALIGSPHSETALWEKVGNWDVHGHTDTHSCSTTARYDTGRSLSIFFRPDQTALTISGLVVVPGTVYEAIIVASSGEAGVLKAVALSDSTVAFRHINLNTIAALALANSIFIQGLGTFELTGSRRAMASAWEWYEALNGG